MDLTQLLNALCLSAHRRMSDCHKIKAKRNKSEMVTSEKKANASQHIILFSILRGTSLLVSKFFYAFNVITISTVRFFIPTKKEYFISILCAVVFIVCVVSLALFVLTLQMNKFAARCWNGCAKPHGLAARNVPRLPFHIKWNAGALRAAYCANIRNSSRHPNSKGDLLCK